MFMVNEINNLPISSYIIDCQINEKNRHSTFKYEWMTKLLSVLSQFFSTTSKKTVSFSTIKKKIISFIIQQIWLLTYTRLALFPFFEIMFDVAMNWNEERWKLPCRCSVSSFINKWESVFAFIKLQNRHIYIQTLHTYFL